MTERRNIPQLQDIRDYLRGFDFFERYVHGQWEGNLYVETHARRFEETLKALPRLPEGARVLELGAVPYYMTVLVKRFLGADVATLSFFEVESSERTTHIVSNRERGEQFEFEYIPVNIERDNFPFDDAAFDLVLCCEILEHLLINPSHMLYEIHRVLRPQGRLIVTTPNAVRWGNLFSLMGGRNIYDRYHGNGIYGRHNREYAPAEVRELLEANSFSVEKLETINVYGSEWLNSFPLLFPERRDNIFAVARADGQKRMAFPASLYVLMEEYRNVVHSALVMGRNDVGQLGRGWHDFEEGRPGFRWTGERAQFELRNQGARALKLQVCCHHPDVLKSPVELSLSINGRAVGTKSLADKDWHELVFKLDEKEPVLRGELVVSRTWIPMEGAAGNDARALGVAVSRIGLG